MWRKRHAEQTDQRSEQKGPHSRNNSKLSRNAQTASSINGMDAIYQSLFKPNEIKKARLENFGITTRVAPIKANINLTKEAQIEVSKALRTMQKDYSQKNIETYIYIYILGKCIKMAKLNTKGKPKWTATIKQLTQHIFHNLSNEGITSLS